MTIFKTNLFILKLLGFIFIINLSIILMAYFLPYIFEIIQKEVPSQGYSGLWIKRNFECISFVTYMDGIKHGNETTFYLSDTGFFKKALIKHSRYNYEKGVLHGQYDRWLVYGNKISGVYNKGVPMDGWFIINPAYTCIDNKVYCIASNSEVMSLNDVVLPPDYYSYENFEKPAQIIFLQKGRILKCTEIEVFIVQDNFFSR